jgi:predicted TIM-barrel fold metal-dependent hydrolase
VIFDGHAYCWPDLTGDGGFDDPNALRRHLQSAIANHHQPALRVRDRARGDNSALADLSRRTRLDALKEADFGWAGNGRFEWSDGEETYFKQYFAPSMREPSYGPDSLVAEMDYAGVDMALLHRTPYLGIDNDFIADSVSRFPDRLKGLAHVPEWRAAPDPDRSLAELERAIGMGLSGLHFLPPQLNLYGDSGAWDRPEFHPFWDGVASLDIPVFISMGQMMNRGASREGLDPDPEDFRDELRTLRRWIDRYPDVTVVVTHGLNWRFFMENDRLVLPEWVWEPFKDSNTYLQLLFPIALGAIWDYPMPQAQPTVVEIVDRLGAGRVMWGTDMPIVARAWTYQQNLDFIRVHCDELSDADRAAVLGGTAAGLLGVG